jgi:hypothetical protein
MGIAGQMAQDNMAKNDLAKEYETLVVEIKNMEKKREVLKAKLLPQMSKGERIGLVECVEIADALAIDDELLTTLEKELGSEVVKREVNTKFLRTVLETNKELDKRIPRAPAKTQLRVGEPR